MSARLFLKTLVPMPEPTVLHRPRGIKRHFSLHPQAPTTRSQNTVVAVLRRMYFVVMSFEQQKTQGFIPFDVDVLVYKYVRLSYLHLYMRDTKKERKKCCFAGLLPRLYNTGSKQNWGRHTRCSLLREALKKTRSSPFSPHTPESACFHHCVKAPFSVK